MTSLGEWWEDRRTEGLGTGLSLLLVAAGVLGVVWVGRQAIFGNPGRGADTPGTLVGKDVSALHLLDEEGRACSLSEYRGRVVLVDFWASWCPPCRMSLPELAALQAGEGADYAVIPVSLDRGGFSDVRPFFQANPTLALKAMIPAEPQRLREDVGSIHSIPTTLLIDRRGKVIQAWSGFSPGRLEKALKAALTDR